MARRQLLGAARWALILSLLLPLTLAAPATVQAATTITFTGGEVLGKPTDTSITINIVPAATIEYYYEYGTAPGDYDWDTLPAVQAVGGQPHEIVIGGLTPNTRYYYRMRYHAPGDAADDWVTRNEHTFHTQRDAGETFVFAVISDSHAQMNTTHRTAMSNILADGPDFCIDLGDNFLAAGGLSNTTNPQPTVNQRYLAYRDPLYLGKIGPSVPLFMLPGNHEEEEGWNLDDMPYSIGVASIQARKAYYPTPIDDAFYSGCTDPLTRIDDATYGDQFRENYYAWEWGDALFVVIDPFEYTPTLTYTPAAGEGGDETSIIKDQWIWTLGAEQFNWLRETLENSDAAFKFMFSHNMVGGIPRAIIGVDAGYVRGGAEAAQYFEWGGKSANGTYAFNDYRDAAVFGTKPIHQLMVENNVSAYFHGHDHQYVYELRDGIVYQEVPSPSWDTSGFGGIYIEGEHDGYSTIEQLPSAGHLRITVGPEQATVEYVRSSTTGVSHTYTMTPRQYDSYELTVAANPEAGGVTAPAVGTHTYGVDDLVAITATPNPGYVFDEWSGDCTGSGPCSVLMDRDRAVTAHFSLEPTTSVLGDVNGDGNADSADALIILSADVGLDTSAFCPMNCGDVNEDGYVNSVDGLIVLSFNVGLPVSQPVGQPGCPISVTPPPGCVP